MEGLQFSAPIGQGPESLWSWRELIRGVGEVEEVRAMHTAQPEQPGRREGGGGRVVGGEREKG